MKNTDVKDTTTRSAWILLTAACNRKEGWRKTGHAEDAIQLSDTSRTLPTPKGTYSA